MSTDDKEVRTPEKRLLVGQLEMKDGSPILWVQSRGKRDMIEIGLLLDLIKKFLKKNK